MDHANFQGIAHQDFDNVEAEGDIGEFQHAQPRHGASDDAASLFPIHGIERTSKVLTAPGFDLCENEDVAMTTDKIDLATTVVSKIPIKDLVSLLPQVPGGELLPFAA